MDASTAEPPVPEKLRMIAALLEEAARELRDLSDRIDPTVPPAPPL